MSLLDEMRKSLLERLEAEPPVGRDRRKGRYPIGLTDWDEELDRAGEKDNAPTRLVSLE